MILYVVQKLLFTFFEVNNFLDEHNEIILRKFMIASWSRKYFFSPNLYVQIEIYSNSNTDAVEKQGDPCHCHPGKYHFFHNTCTCTLICPKFLRLSLVGWFSIKMNIPVSKVQLKFIKRFLFQIHHLFILVDLYVNKNKHRQIFKM